MANRILIIDLIKELSIIFRKIIYRYVTNYYNYYDYTLLYKFMK
jgi:hypothetical protein